MKRFEFFKENGKWYLHLMCNQQHYGQQCLCRILPLNLIRGNKKC
jgi:hypothetical protein